MDTCHHCEQPTEWTCPDCDNPTCEDCFVPMTQFNAGSPLPCVVCERGYNNTRLTESSRQYEIEQVKEEKRIARNRSARANYNTPTARAKREAAKQERMAAKLNAEINMFKHLADVIKSFS